MEQSRKNSNKNTCKFVNKSARKRKNKRKKKKNKQKIDGGVTKSFSEQNVSWTNQTICKTMASWAYNYSNIVTWQSKHEASYWKAKATALEYENKILHEIIRKNQLVSSSESSSECSDHEDMSVQDEVSDQYVENVTIGENDDIEVSQEYIDFLVANAKYREDARREREKFRGNVDNEEQVFPPNLEDAAESAKKQYGDKCRKIIANEMAVDAQFMEAKDRLRPEYWPNTPFNLNI